MDTYVYAAHWLITVLHRSKRSMGGDFGQYSAENAPTTSLFAAERGAVAPAEERDVLQAEIDT